MEEKNWGRGDVDREGTGVEVAVDGTEYLSEPPGRKLGPNAVELKAGKGKLVLGWEWVLKVSVDSALIELS